MNLLPDIAIAVAMYTKIYFGPVYAAVHACGYCSLYVILISYLNEKHTVYLTL